MTYRGILFSPDGRYHEEFEYSNVDHVLAGLDSIRGRWPRFPLAVILNNHDQIVYADEACKRLINMDFNRARTYLKVNYHSIARDPDIISD